MKPGAQRSEVPGYQHPRSRTPAGVTEARELGEFEMTRITAIFALPSPFQGSRLLERFIPEFR
jgi:hypothetical protein